MQRLSSWFDRLTHKRSSKSSRKSQKKAAASENRSQEDFWLLRSASSKRALASWEEWLERAPPPLADLNSCQRQETEPKPPTTLERKRIRTNPWFLNETSTRPGQLPTESDIQTFSRHTLAAHLFAKSQPLNESTCSSGYGSHDSSPESSVHAPNWQFASTTTLEKAVCCTEADVDAALGEDDGADSDYCEWEQCFAKFDANGNRAHSRPPSFHPPPPPPLHGAPPPPPCDALLELDTRIAVLRSASRQLRRAARRAADSRELRLKDKQLCLDQIGVLRGLRWVVREDFELNL